MYYRILCKIYKRAARKMCLACEKFIKKGSAILDLGCGSAIIGKTFQDFFQAEIIGVDIRDIRRINIPFKLYDGKNLPFAEKSFDIVLINYVLHHCQDPTAVLREAKRVSRDKIIVFEDLPEGFLSELICRLHGLSYHLFRQQKNPSFFKTENQWEKIFQEIGLKVIFKERRHNFPYRKELFVLG